MKHGSKGNLKGGKKDAYAWQTLGKVVTGKCSALTHVVAAPKPQKGSRPAVIAMHLAEIKI